MTETPMSTLDARARELMLASLAAGYPDRELAETFAEWPAASPIAGHVGLGPVARAAAADLVHLQERYVGLFDTGKDRASLYETEHGRMRGLAKGNDLADISGFYLAFGLTPDDELQHEMLDHVAVELEFYGLLLVKQSLLEAAGDAEGVAIVTAARRSFLRDHLGRFVSAIASHGGVDADTVYGPLFRWCAELIAEECRGLEVRPAPLDFFAADREGDAVECGSVVRLPVVD